jgi:hypothetical protein
VRIFCRDKPKYPVRPALRMRVAGKAFPFFPISLIKQRDNMKKLKLLASTLLACGVTSVAITSAIAQQICTESRYAGDVWIGQEISEPCDALDPSGDCNNNQRIRVVGSWHPQYETVQVPCPVVPPPCENCAGGTGTRPPREAERIARCNKNTADQAYYLCSERSGLPPANSGRIHIPDSYRTGLNPARDAILAHLNRLYDSDDINVWQSYSTGLREALSACGNATDCVRLVTQYYGGTRVSIPDIPVIGNLDSLINTIINTFSVPTYQGSDAHALFRPYINGKICNGLKEKASIDKCGG